MPLRVTPIREEEKSVLDNLLQLYMHEMSRYDDRVLGDDGRYSYNSFESYFTQDGRHAYLIRVRGKLAGFVLVKIIDSVTSAPIHSIAEFFVIEVYRRLGIGEEVARILFDQHPGTWQVAQQEENAVSRAFWKHVVWRYTAKEYREFRSPDWNGPIFEFVSRGNAMDVQPVEAPQAAEKSPSKPASQSQFS